MPSRSPRRDTLRGPPRRPGARRLATLAVLALAGSACQCSRQAPGITPQAAALFARADESGAGGSLVVDLDALRKARLLSSDDGATFAMLANLGVNALPTLAAASDDEATGKLMMRAAVVIGLLRDWDAWPQVQRFGAIARLGADPTALASAADKALLVLAVRGDEAATTELLKGLGALDRSGGQPLMTWQDGNLCFSAALLPVSVCARAGNGYIAFATPEALKALPAPSEGSRAAEAIAPILRLRAEMPFVGKGELLVESKEGLRIAASIHTEQAEVAAQFEKTANEWLAALDKNQEERRTKMAPVLDQTKATVTADAEAPASLKAVAAKATIDSLLDPDGTYGKLRRSLKITRNNGALSAEATIPSEYLASLTSTGGVYTTVAVAGVVAAIAVPNFIKFQCRSKQSEARANLTALHTAQMAHYQEKAAWGASFADIGFSPEAGNYTYCMNSACIPCGKPGCRTFEDDANPCLRLLGMGEGTEGYSACAVADLDSSADPGDVDVWVVADGAPPHQELDDCQ